MTSEDAVRRAAAMHEQMLKNMDAMETSEQATAATIGRALVHLLGKHVWPTEKDLTDLLEATAEGSVRLNGVTTSMAKAAAEIIASLQAEPEA